ncbi:Cation/H(+) antiporter 15, partial [Cucurbita argyrosperma subsp. sororia]
MSSILMEPDDLAVFVGGSASRTSMNFTTLCTSAHRIHSAGVFSGVNPLEFSVPLLLLQFGICAGTIILFHQLLKPLGQPLIVSQILGGLVLGSSGLSHMKTFRDTIFPLRGFVFLDVVTSFGTIFYFFLVGVQVDISIMKNIDKKSLGIGTFSVILPLILTSLYSTALMNTVGTRTAKSLLIVSAAESFINFPMVASLLSELHLMNSEFGRIALSSSMVSTVWTFCFVMIGALVAPQNGAVAESVISLSTFIMVSGTIIFVVRQAMSWIIKNSPTGEPLKEGFVVAMLLGVLITAFSSKAFGLHIYFGPLILGISIPPGPPIGSALVERLDFITSWVFMPVFFVKLGLVINVYSIKLKNFLGVSFVIYVSALGKFLGALVVAVVYCRMPVRDAVSLGLVMASQGAFELGMFKLMRKEGRIDRGTFAVMCIFLMVLMAVITPIIRYLFDPSRRYTVYKRRTVMDLKPGSDLRVLICIHDQEDVPNAINLLEALNPTRRSHLIVYMLHLVELLGRANSQLIPHNLKKDRISTSCPSEHIVNAFKYFGRNNRQTVAIFPFTSITSSTTMHDDVYLLALNKTVSLILVPFHKKFYSNGVISLSNYDMKMVNNEILDKAPCSIGLVVDRGVLNLSRSAATNLHSFQVAVVFLGGADDREAMFVGARMAGHPDINLTLIRLLKKGNVERDDVKETRLDNEAVLQFRKATTNNRRVMYIEEVVMDGTGTVSLLRSMGNNFNLVIVGRRHSYCSTLVQGLVLWNEQTELGAIGEVLASSDFMGNAIILVVQQHTKLANEEQNKNNEDSVTPIDRHLAKDEAKELSIQTKPYMF